MPKHTVRFGSVQYVDHENMHRIGYENEEIDFPADEAKRLLDLGALFPKGTSEEPAEDEPALPIPTPEPSEPVASPPAPPAEPAAESDDAPAHKAAKPRPVAK